MEDVFGVDVELGEQVVVVLDAALEAFDVALEVGDAVDEEVDLAVALGDFLTEVVDGLLLDVVYVLAELGELVEDGDLFGVAVGVFEF
jgi:hypothetical protein